MTTPTVPNQGLFWRESASLKAHLDDQILLPSSAYPDGQPVPAYFSLPDGDVRRRQFPYVMIDQLTVRRETDREHRGHLYLGPDSQYRPDGLADDETLQVRSDLPIPLKILFQVSGWSRNRQHQLMMAARFMTLLPERFGALAMVGDRHARDDNTDRRMDLESGPDTSEEIEPGQEDTNKRIFRVTAVVGVSSEIFYADLVRIPLVERVVIDPASRAGYESITD